MECFAAVGGFRGFPFASSSPDTSSDGRGDGCPWVGCVFPGREYRYGWGPPEDARLASGGGGGPLTFIKTGQLLVPPHGCWMVCGGASTA